MNKKESNKLIAKFIKLEVGIYPSNSGKGYWCTPIGDIERNEAERLLYHTSWGWLMPVVEKIIKSDEGASFHKSGLQDADIDKTYKSVIDYIEHYNLKT